MLQFTPPVKKMAWRGSDNKNDLINSRCTAVVLETQYTVFNFGLNTVSSKLMSWKGLIKISFMKDFLNSYFIKYCKLNAQNEETSRKRRKNADTLYLCSSPNKNLNHEKENMVKIKWKSPYVNLQKPTSCFFVCLCQRWAGWLAATHGQMAVRWRGLEQLHVTLSLV